MSTPVWINGAPQDPNRPDVVEHLETVRAAEEEAHREARSRSRRAAAQIVGGGAVLLAALAAFALVNYVVVAAWRSSATAYTFGWDVKALLFLSVIGFIGTIGILPDSKRLSRRRRIVADAVGVVAVLVGLVAVLMALAFIVTDLALIFR